jgi:hypothetical protein
MYAQSLLNITKLIYNNKLQSNPLRFKAAVSVRYDHTRDYRIDSE